VSEAFLLDDQVVFVDGILDGNSHWLLRKGGIAAFDLRGDLSCTLLQRHR
jgi:hypothetical protein